MLRNLRHAGLSVLMIATCATAAYPERPVRYILPSAAGGGPDVTVRLIAAELSQQMGQQFVVDNRPGASGTIGTQLIARAKPDGYTIGHGNTPSLAINRSIFAKLPYDPDRDLQPIVQTIRIHNMLTISLTLSVKSVPELIDYAKKNPGKLVYAVTGVGTTPHLSVELFKQMTGTQMRHVAIPPATAIAAMVMGQVHMWIQNITAVEQYVRTGRIRGLAVTSLKRAPAFPELPTVAESGLAGFEVMAWAGIVVPAGVPRAIVTRLNAEVNKALVAPALREKLAPLGVEFIGGTPEQFADYIRKESVKWGDVVRRAGIKPE